MDPGEAQARLEAYKTTLRKRHAAEIREEYKAAAAGYEALARGTPLINLQNAIRSGGFDEKMRPRLAVARGDRKQVKFRWSRSSATALFTTASRNYRRGSDTLDLRIEMGRRPYDEGVKEWWICGWALVPMAPPEALEAIGGGSYLKNHFILWEVEEWADSPIQIVPDRDPLLLRHIAGDLYAVMAQWDLTELERQVMTGRRDG